MENLNKLLDMARIRVQGNIPDNNFLNLGFAQLFLIKDCTFGLTLSALIQNVRKCTSDKSKALNIKKQSQVSTLSKLYLVQRDLT